FLMILPGADREVAIVIADRVRKRIEQLSLDRVGHITISAGVAFWLPAIDGTMEETFKQADDALYQAKNGGRNQVVVAPGANETPAVAQGLPH
ncbi:MAG TPA: diguanylate cyclase, partial [Erwinia persicina]|nr:diguanylate cyclase [Erwinia persicina]